MLLLKTCFVLLNFPPLWEFHAPFRLIFLLFWRVGIHPFTSVWHPAQSPLLTILAAVRDVTLGLLTCILQCTEEVIFINNKVDTGWIVLCLMFHKKGPTLYFICHCCFSFLKQCSIVFHKKKNFRFHEQRNSVLLCSCQIPISVFLLLLTKGS